MNYDLHTIIITLASSVMGGGLGSYIMRLIMKNEAKEALKPELDKIESDILSIKENYVNCQVCSSKHNSVDAILADMNRKLDILIANAIKQ